MFSMIIFGYFGLFFTIVERTAAAMDNTAEMNRRKARLSMKIGAKV